MYDQQSENDQVIIVQVMTRFPSLKGSDITLSDTQLLDDEVLVLGNQTRNWKYAETGGSR